MKKQKRIVIGAAVLTSVAAALITVVALAKEKKRVAVMVSEEGYETARDILYPGKRGYGKLHYGPVIPA